MPAINAIKTYVADSYYHIYNRGVEKRPIFVETRDYKIFLSYLKLYLILQELSLKDNPPSRRLRNFYGKVDLCAYELMPNHFHLMVYQRNSNDIEKFMRSLTTKYVRYFNTHYGRVGHLFQDRYKAVLIESKDQLVYTSKYIHRNCIYLYPGLPSRTVLEGYKYSSYLNYVGTINQAWVKPERVLTSFKKLYPEKLYADYVLEEEESSFGDFKDCP